MALYTEKILEGLHNVVCQESGEVIATIDILDTSRFEFFATDILRGFSEEELEYILLEVKRLNSTGLGD